jgi:hypothetical protein
MLHLKDIIHLLHASSDILGSGKVKQERRQKKFKNPPGAYRIGIFWKIHFINPPEG